MARLALTRARDKTISMEERYTRDLRIDHVHQLYDHKGRFLHKDSSVKSERKMVKQYDRLVQRQKGVESMYQDLVMYQDLYNNRFTYIGERLVDIVQRHTGIGIGCECMQAARTYKWRSDCDRCCIPANVLTTIALPHMVSHVGKHVYLVEYAKGGKVQVCAPDGLMINLGWNEAAAIAWCAHGGSLSKGLFANTKFAIPLGYRKKLVVDMLHDTFELHGAAGICIPLPSYDTLAKLQHKCREFGFRSIDVAKVSPFIPHFFHKE